MSSSSTENDPPASSASHRGRPGQPRCLRRMPDGDLGLRGDDRRVAEAPGDWVEADETICDVTTDKIDVEIPSPATGATPADPGRAGARRSRSAPRSPDRPGAKAGEAHPDEHDGTARRHRPRGTGGRGDRSLAVPLPRRQADGREARGRPDEGRRARDRRTDPEEGRAGVHRPAAPRPSGPLHRESPYQQAQEPSEPRRPPTPARRRRSTPNGASREPMTAMRRSIAEHMTESRRTAAHCTTIVEVDFTGSRAAPSCAGDGAARRQADLPGLRGRGGRGGPWRSSRGPERLGRGRRARLSRRRQPRHRGLRSTTVSSFP